MARANLFDILHDDSDNDDPSHSPAASTDNDDPSSDLATTNHADVPPETPPLEPPPPAEAGFFFSYNPRRDRFELVISNPFDVLRDDDNDDPSSLLAEKALAAVLPAKFPSRPPCSADAAREAKVKAGGGQGGGRDGHVSGRGHGELTDRCHYGSDETALLDNAFGESEDEELEWPTVGRRGYLDGRRSSRRRRRGSRWGGYSVGDGYPPSRRQFDRKSDTRRRNKIKRNGCGRGNWGILTDQGQSENLEELELYERMAVPHFVMRRIIHQMRL